MSAAVCIGFLLTEGICDIHSMSPSECQPYTVAGPGAGAEGERAGALTDTQTKTAVSARSPDQGC